MNANFLKPALCACGLIAATVTAPSTPLQRSDVAAEPVWVLHVDCDALRPTTIGQFLLAEMEKPDAQAKFSAFQSIFNFDPRRQLHGLTLYSTGKTPEDGVLLVYADFDPDRLVTLAKAAKDYHGSAYKQHTIHNWIDEKKKEKEGVKPRVYASIQGGHIVVFAQQEARVPHRIWRAAGRFHNWAPAAAPASSRRRPARWIFLTRLPTPRCSGWPSRRAWRLARRRGS
jgi:hypothetical protein